MSAVDPFEIPASWKTEDKPLFVSAQQPGLSAPFEQLVESFFHEDIAASYGRVEKSLRLGEDRTDYAAVSEALDEAEDNARIAHRLFINAKLEQRRFEVEKEVLEAGMWSEARECLEQERAGTKSRAPTLDDVRYKLAQLYPDGVARLRLGEEKEKRACDHLEQLADLAKGRCRTLQTILMTMRK